MSFQDQISFRQIQNEDIDFVFRGLSDPEVHRYYGIKLYTKEDAQFQMRWYESLHNSNTGYWSLIMVNGKPVGALGLHDLHIKSGEGELGIWIIPEFWHRGIAKASLMMAIELWEQRFNLQSIIADVEEQNTACIYLLESLGFETECYNHNIEETDTGYISTYTLRLICDTRT